MQSLDPTVLLLQLGILLVAAFLLGRLAESVRLPATTGELITGLVLGPSLLGSIAVDHGAPWIFASGQNEFLRGIAAFAGALLVGIAGATVDLGFVRARLRAVVSIGLGSLGLPLLTTVVLALVAGSVLRGPHGTLGTFAAYAGLALSVSAVPVIVKIFSDLRLLHRNLSQLSLSIAVIDDAVVWIGLSIIAAVVHLGGGADVDLLAELPFTVAAAMALALLVVIARRMAAADRSASTGRSRPGVGVWCLIAAAVIILGAVVTDGVGLDWTLGAFLGGAVLGRGRIVPVAGLRPLRTVVLGVLAPLFLAVGGLTADLRTLLEPRTAIAAVIVIVIAIATKLAGAYAGGRFTGLVHGEALAVASALNARGTVQLVVAATGLRLGLITVEGFTILVLVALVTSAMAGPMLRRQMRRVPVTADEERRGDGG